VGIGADPEPSARSRGSRRGDARRALAMLEARRIRAHDGREGVTKEILAASEEKAPLLYDKAGEEHYNVVSAFIKSMRGSESDAAVYWMMRMLEAGDDPLFVTPTHARLRERDVATRTRARS